MVQNADYLKATAVNPLLQLLSGQSTMMSIVFKPYNYNSGMKDACMVLCYLFSTPNNCKQMALTLLVDVSQLPSQLEWMWSASTSLSLMTSLLNVLSCSILTWTYQRQLQIWVSSGGHLTQQLSTSWMMMVSELIVSCVLMLTWYDHTNSCSLMQLKISTFPLKMLTIWWRRA